MTTEQIKTQELYAQVVEKAWENTEFKKQLIADPVGTIEKMTGRKVGLPHGKSLVVVDQAELVNIKPEDDKTYFVIPENNQANFELSEEELESVAGGLTIVVKFDKNGHFDGIDIDLTLF